MSDEPHRKVHTFFRAYDRVSRNYLGEHGRSTPDPNVAIMHQLKMNLTNAIQNSHYFRRESKHIVVQEVDIVVVNETDYESK